jgi:hypothetical protein
MIVDRMIAAARTHARSRQRARCERSRSAHGDSTIQRRSRDDAEPG